MGYIYLITNLITNEKYIGQTLNFKTRVRYHKSFYTTKDSILYRSMRTYGIENFKFEILINVEDSLLCELEEKYTIEFNTMYPNGLNQIKKFNRSSNFSHSTESIKKISDSKLGCKNPMYEKSHSIEVKNSIRDSVLNSIGDPILMIRYSTKEIINRFLNRTFAEQETGIKKGTIWSRLNKKMIVNAIIWMYESDYNMECVKCNDYRNPQKPFGRK